MMVVWITGYSEIGSAGLDRGKFKAGIEKRGGGEREMEGGRPSVFLEGREILLGGLKIEKNREKLSMTVRVLHEQYDACRRHDFKGKYNGLFMVAGEDSSLKVQKEKINTGETGMGL